MVMENVSLFVEQDFPSMLFVVLLADDDAAHPTAWSDIVSMAIDGEAILLLFPHTSTTHQHTHANKLPHPEQQHQRHAYQAQDTDDGVP